MYKSRDSLTATDRLELWNWYYRRQFGGGAATCRTRKNRSVSGNRLQLLPLSIGSGSVTAVFVVRQAPVAFSRSVAILIGISTAARRWHRRQRSNNSVLVVDSLTLFPQRVRPIDGTLTAELGRGRSGFDVGSPRWDVALTAVVAGRIAPVFCRRFLLFPARIFPLITNSVAVRTFGGRSTVRRTFHKTSQSCRF